jgi:hypothetical protein
MLIIQKGKSVDWSGSETLTTLGEAFRKALEHGKDKQQKESRQAKAEGSTEDRHGGENQKQDR